MRPCNREKLALFMFLISTCEIDDWEPTNENDFLFKYFEMLENL